MKFSIIIPIKNSEETLQWCLQSVMLQAGEDDYEVICVDNGSSDGSVGIVERFRDKYPKKIKLLHSSASTVSGVRNAGAKESKGEFFAFLDSDCIAPAWWLKEAERLIDKGYEAFGGGYLAEKENWIYNAWEKVFKYNKPKVVNWVPAGNFFVKRSLFESISGFDSHLITSEDVDICHRLELAGVNLFYSPKLDVVHLGEPKSLWEFFEKELWRGKGVLCLFLKHKGVVGAKPLLLGMYSLLYVAVFVVLLFFRFEWAILLLVLGFLPYFMLALKKSDFSNEVFSLGVLYFVYGLARGLAIIFK